MKHLLIKKTQLSLMIWSHSWLREFGLLVVEGVFWFNVELN